MTTAPCTAIPTRGRGWGNATETARQTHHKTSAFNGRTTRRERGSRGTVEAFERVRQEVINGLMSPEPRASTVDAKPRDADIARYRAGTRPDGICTENLARRLALVDIRWLRLRRETFRLNELLGCPRRRRVRRAIDMHDPAAVMREDHEHEQQAASERGDGEEIHRRESRDMRDSL